jgi:hypothetical protein
MKWFPSGFDGDFVKRLNFCDPHCKKGRNILFLNRLTKTPKKVKPETDPVFSTPHEQSKRRARKRSVEIASPKPGLGEHQIRPHR